MWPFRKRSTGSSSQRINFGSPEARSSIEDPRIPLSSPEAWASLFGTWQSSAGVVVTRDTALQVPAVWCAVNFLSGTFAALPAPVYQKTKEGREKAEGNNIAVLLHDWVNDDYLTSFAWRKQSMANVLLDGRSLTFAEGKRTGKVTNLWPIDHRHTTVKRGTDGRKKYVLRETSGEKVYDADEIIDMAFMMTADGRTSVNPVEKLKGAIGLAIAQENYAAKFFENGGVPPLAMQMPAGATGGAAARGTADIEALIKTTGRENRLVVPMPQGHRLEPVGFKPSDGQLIDGRKMQLREVARFYCLPPVFLQDLEYGTFSNTEQQDLMLVKHTLVQWLRAWEGELNAKLFGPRSRYFLEFNVDGLLRGDFTSRMAGYATGIQNAVLKPDEARDMENRPREGGNADKLLIQGATVPLSTAGLKPGVVPSNGDGSGDGQGA